MKGRLTQSPGAVQQWCQRSATGVEQDLEKSLASERRKLRNRLDNEFSPPASQICSHTSNVKVEVVQYINCSVWDIVFGKLMF